MLNVAEELADRAKGEESFLVNLGAVLIQYHQITLERAFERTGRSAVAEGLQSGDDVVSSATSDADRLASPMIGRCCPSRECPGALIRVR